MQKIEISGLQCLCSAVVGNERIAYVLYPVDMLSDWIETASEKHNTTIVVITGMDWQNVFSPWAATGVPKGSPDFKGEAPGFLHMLQHTVIPRIEQVLGFGSRVERSLIGVSMSGLFALWQWMMCDTFRSIASLSGSFWYEGFIDWMASHTIPAKSGKGFFLLGNQESKYKVWPFDSVGVNTAEIMRLLENAGIDVEFLSVAGNHFSDPLPRLEAALGALYPNVK